MTPSLKSSFEPFELLRRLCAGLILASCPRPVQAGPGKDAGRLREKISFVDKLTFLEGDTDELAIDAATHGDGVEA